jgi:dTMP kinase
MTLLFAADRLDHVETEVAPRLRDGDVVISDRYDLSSLCYQSIAPDVPPNDGVLDPVGDAAPASVAAATPTVEWIRALNRCARRPDITLVLDVSPTVAAQRRCLRGGPAELFDDSRLQRELADAYRRCDDLVPGDRVVHVNGDAQLSEVHAEIVRAIDPLLFPGVARAHSRGG